MQTSPRNNSPRPRFTKRIVELAPAESQAILSYLYAHSVKPEYVVRHRWAEGDVAFWDNRATWHLAVNDYHGHRRIMHRITLAGDTPV